MNLSPTAQRFVLHWGEMSGHWGINRTMAQIHALLYLSAEPLNAEQIAETLSVARSNVSISLRELRAWGIVRIVHVLGDRRDHFETVQDAWEMFRLILDQRKRREIDPTRTKLQELVAQAGQGGPEESYPRERMNELLQVLELLTLWYEQVGKLPTTVQKKVLSMGSKIEKLAR